MFAMPSPLPLREDYDGAQLRRLARRSGDADQTRRLLALAAIYEGARRGEAAEIGGVGRQIIRDWVEAFNELGPEGLVDGQAPGASPRLSPEHRAALARAVEAGPDPDVDGVVRWRLADLAQWFWRVHGVPVSRQTVGRVLRQMGYRNLRPRPRDHQQDPDTIDTFKKTSMRTWRKSTITKQKAKT
jgi:transposase